MFNPRIGCYLKIQIKDLKKEGEMRDPHRNSSNLYVRTYK